MTELVTPFCDLFLKVADFQFKYAKKILEKEKLRRDIFDSNIAFPQEQFCCLRLVNHQEFTQVNVLQ